MRIEYDKTAKALYIRVRNGKVARTIRLKDALIVDLNKNNEILGIEMLEPALPFDGMKLPYRIAVNVK
jgi:uncharacterized protein YuzE